MNLAHVHPCYLCGEPARAACDCLGERAVSIAAKDVVEGDTIKAQSRLQRPVYWTVIGVELQKMDSFWPKVSITAVKPRAGHMRESTRLFHPTIAILVMRPGKCASAACEAHIRELGDKTHCCRQHWKAWEQAA